MLSAFAEVDAAFPWFFPTCVAVFGACVGSFLNVVIYRMPAGRSVVHPGSHCQCGAPIAWYDNVPVLGWVLLRGRARCCGGKISVRYALVEAATAWLFWSAWTQFDPMHALVVMLFAAWMLVPALIDLDTMEIPDLFSVGGFVLGVVVSVAVPALHLYAGDWWMLDAMRAGFSAVTGGLIASGLILWVALLAEAVLRKEAMGFGDVKLMGAIGAFCGWQGGVFALFGGAILGTFAFLLYAGWARLAGKSGGAGGAADVEENPKTLEIPPEAATKPEDSDEAAADDGARIPFGPALAAAAVVYLLWGQPYVDAYFGTFIELLYRQF